MKNFRNCQPGNFFINYVLHSLFFCLMFSSKVLAQESGAQDVEKKVDYLERIYFSGEDKEGLNAQILVALQEIQEKKAPTPSLAKQVTFLLDIQDDAEAAANACDVLDLLSVGIYHIDAADALKEGVQAPSEKAKQKGVDAVASLNKLNSTSNNLSNSAGNLAWSSYLLSGGRYGSFASGAGKVAGAAGTVGATAGALGAVGQTAKGLADVGKSLNINFKKKDKPCKSVQQKDIAIGNHTLTPVIPDKATANTQPPVPAAGEIGTTLLVRNIAFDQIEAFVGHIKDIAGVSAVVQANFDNSIVTLQITHNMQTGQLVKKILDANSKMKLKVEGFTANQATLTIAK